MRQSESITDLASALSKAQGAFKPIYKNKTMSIPNRNDYQYADLAEIIKTVQPELSSHGLSVCQIVDMDDKGSMLITRLMHSSGQWVEGCLPLGNHAKHQDFGIELSYKRRYALCSILGIMAEDDVDGHQENVPSPVKGKPPGQSVDPSQRLITENEWKGIALKLKGAFDLDKDGIANLVLKVTGKTTPRTLTYGDLLALENEIGLKQLDKGLPL